MSLDVPVPNSEARRFRASLDSDSCRVAASRSARGLVDSEGEEDELNPWSLIAIESSTSQHLYLKGNTEKKSLNN